MNKWFVRLDGMTNSQVRNEVSKQIVKGNIGKYRLDYIIKYLENTRPDIFNDNDNSFVKLDDPKKWDNVYLRQIQNTIVCGYFCRDILYHLQMVADRLLFFKYKLGVLGLSIILLGIICFLIFIL